MILRKTNIVKKNHCQDQKYQMIAEALVVEVWLGNSKIQT